MGKQNYWAGPPLGTDITKKENETIAAIVLGLFSGLGIAIVSHEAAHWLTALILNVKRSWVTPISAWVDDTDAVKQNLVYISGNIGNLVSGAALGLISLAPMPDNLKHLLRGMTIVEFLAPLVLALAGYWR